MATKILTQANFAHIWQTIKSTFAKKTDLDGYVAKVDGKSLTSNDFTDALKTKLEGVASGAQVNTLEGIKVNGTVVNPTDKVVNIDLSAYATKTAVNNKVDKAEGKGLSTEDYTTAEKTKLAGIAAGANPNVIEAVKVNGTALTVTDKAVNVDLSDYATTQAVADGYVAKETGKGLSANDFTDTLKTKLDGVAAGAEVNTIETIRVNGTASAPSNKVVDITVPTKVSQITNDSGFQTAAEVTASIATAVADITSFDYQTVDTLPATGVKGTVYLIPATGGSGQNVKEEYIWIGTGYEMLGTTEMDLTGYWNETNLQLATNADIDAIINAE